MAEDLVGKYLLGLGNAKSSSDPGDLVSQYLLPPAQAAEPTVPSNERIIAPPVSGVSEVRSQQLLKENNTSYVEPSGVEKARSSLALPIENVGSNIAKNFKGGVDQTIQGAGEIFTGRPATGVGNVGLGLLSAVVSPISGTADAIGQGVETATGIKRIGDKTSFVLTAGLPIRSAGNKVKSNLPTNKATSELVDTIGKENIPEVLSRMRENPRLSLADIVPAVRRMGQKLVLTEGPHQNKFEKFVNDRITSRKGSVEAAFDEAMGVPVNIVTKIKELKQSAKDVGNKDINPAVKGAGPVDLSGVIKGIDEKLRPGINSVVTAGQPLPLTDVKKALEGVKGLLTDGKSVRTDANDLHNFQSALRAKADDLINSTEGSNRQLGYALMNVRNQIVEAIDAVSPKIKNAKGEDIGSYKAGLAKYRDEMQIQDAFTKGQLVTRNRLGQLEDHPEYWKEWVKSASTEQIEAAKEGARLAVDHQINAARHAATKGESIGQIEFNRQKLETLFGKEEVSTLSKRLRDETAMSETNSDLIKNSQTAMRLKADSRIDPPQFTPISKRALPALIAEAGNIASGGYPGAAAAALTGAEYAKKFGFDKIVQKLHEKKNSNIADMITATGEKRGELIKTLQDHLPQSNPPSLRQRARNFALPVIPP